MRPHRRLGWNPSRPDPRDAYFAPPNRFGLGLPSIHSNRAICSPVENQGGLGSCTGNATVGMLEALMNREIHKKSGKPTPHFVDLSRLFVYWWARKIGGYPVTEDTGAQIRDCLKALAKHGVCPEELHPYGEEEDFWVRKPSVIAEESARNRQILRYFRLDQKGPPTARALEWTLSRGYLVAFGFSVPEGFEDDILKGNGVMSQVTKATRYDGGHAVALIGYDSKRKLFEIRNSWGTEWGDAGHFWMPYATLLDAGIADDFWFVARQELG